MPDLKHDEVENFTQELRTAGIAALGLPCDVTDQPTCQAAMQKIIETFGSIDVLINNAGITQRSAFEKTQGQVFRKVKEILDETAIEMNTYHLNFSFL